MHWRVAHPRRSRNEVGEKRLEHRIEIRFVVAQYRQAGHQAVTVAREAGRDAAHRAIDAGVGQPFGREAAS